MMNCVRREGECSAYLALEEIAARSSGHARNKLTSLGPTLSHLIDGQWVWVDQRLSISQATDINRTWWSHICMEVVLDFLYI